MPVEDKPTVPQQSARAYTRRMRLLTTIPEGAHDEALECVMSGGTPGGAAMQQQSETATLPHNSISDRQHTAPQ